MLDARRRSGANDEEEEKNTNDEIAGVVPFTRAFAAGGLVRFKAWGLHSRLCLVFQRPRLLRLRLW